MEWTLGRDSCASAFYYAKGAESGETGRVGGWASANRERVWQRRVAATRVLVKCISEQLDRVGSAAGAGRRDVRIGTVGRTTCGP